MTTDNNSSLTIDDFTQSQSHGLFWDSEIRQRVFGLPECKNDTKKFDICCDENKLNSNENISIKTSGNSNIDCGDILRFYDRDNADITMIVIRYDQNTSHKTISEIVELNYNEELRDILFGSVTRDILEEYVKFVRDIHVGKVSKEIKNEYIKMKNEIQKNYNMKINISPKVDSKKQRRVQCSIPKMESLFKDYPQFVLSRTKENIVRGVNITQEIKSTRRIRNTSQAIKSQPTTD